jgi:chromosome segregation ATPase
MTSKEPDPFAGLPERLQGFAGLQAEIDAAGMGDPGGRRIAQLETEVEYLKIAEQRRTEEVQTAMAEVERLQGELMDANPDDLAQARDHAANLELAIGKTWRPEVKALRAEVQRLRADVGTLNGMVAMLSEQIERLKVDLSRARGVSQT